MFGPLTISGSRTTTTGLIGAQPIYCTLTADRRYDFTTSRLPRLFDQIELAVRFVHQAGVSRQAPSESRSRLMRVTMAVSTSVSRVFEFETLRMTSILVPLQAYQ
ncbi:hypothetical protein DAA53_00040 [Bradyrhizobium sp. WBAH23]|nr:hypothetical protein [Bradyrhizobium sp. WBAH33]QCJ79733.1 hypothetical protein DAA53_00040 [Bradyrhizobium sp. WBAH23]QCJ94464.1 hypothetical protein DAA61_00120 [Bradyrhizobium sp. WBAH33]QCK01829.1 hypothetical protein DAB18_00120 [Bradyrhizobium sp. WBAH41]